MPYARRHKPQFPRRRPSGAGHGFPQGLLLTLVAGATSAAEPPTLDDLLAPPFPSQMIAAQGAERLAWVGNERGRRNIWCALPGEGGTWISTQLTSFTADDGQEITNLVFDRAADRLVWIRGGAPNRAGELPNPTSDPTNSGSSESAARCSRRASALSAFV